MKRDLLLYKNNKIRWRWEANYREIIVNQEDKYWRLNESASLVFYFCEGVSFSELVLAITHFSETTSKYVPSTLEELVKTFISEGIVVFKSNSYIEKEKNLRFPNSPLHFVEPKLTPFEIGNKIPTDFERPSSPLRVFFMISYNCNLRCKHCYNPGVKNNNGEVNLCRIKDIIDKIEKAGVFEIILTGGEPFLNAYLFEIVDYILSYGIRVRINTNGLLLTREYIREIKNKKNLVITLGIDGASAKTHDYIRGEGNFQKVITILEMLSQEKIPIYINFTVTHKNLFDVWKLKKFFENFNVLKVIMNVFIKTGYGYSSWKALALNKLEYSTLYLYDFFNSRKTPPIITMILDCYAGYLEAAINSHGDFFFCELLPYSFGNVLEKDVEDLWNTSEIVDLFKARGLEFPCNECLFRKQCRGACRAEVFWTTKKLYAGNPYCTRGKIISYAKKMHIPYTLCRK